MPFTLAQIEEVARSAEELAKLKSSVEFASKTLPGTVGLLVDGDGLISSPARDILTSALLSSDKPLGLNVDDSGRVKLDNLTKNFSYIRPWQNTFSLIGRTWQSPTLSLADKFSLGAHYFGQTLKKQLYAPRRLRALTSKYGELYGDYVPASKPLGELRLHVPALSGNDVKDIMLGRDPRTAYDMFTGGDLLDDYTRKSYDEHLLSLEDLYHTLRGRDRGYIGVGLSSGINDSRAFSVATAGTMFPTTYQLNSPTGDNRTNLFGVLKKSYNEDKRLDVMLKMCVDFFKNSFTLNEKGFQSILKNAAEDIVSLQNNYDLLFDLDKISKEADKLVLRFELGSLSTAEKKLLYSKIIGRIDLNNYNQIFANATRHIAEIKAYLDLARDYAKVKGIDIESLGSVDDLLLNIDFTKYVHAKSDKFYALRRNYDEQLLKDDNFKKQLYDSIFDLDKYADIVTSMTGYTPKDKLSFAFEAIFPRDAQMSMSPTTVAKGVDREIAFSKMSKDQFLKLVDTLYEDGSSLKTDGNGNLFFIDNKGNATKVELRTNPTEGKLEIVFPTELVTIGADPSAGLNKDVELYDLSDANVQPIIGKITGGSKSALLFYVNRSASIDDHGLTGYKTESQRVDEGALSGTDEYEPFVFPEGFHERNNKNVEYIQSVLPGFLPFGSVSLTLAGMPHSPHDYDGAVAEGDWLKAVAEHGWIEGKDYVYINPETITLNLNSSLPGDKGNVDINLIRDDANGHATGPRAFELYRQYFPKEYSEWSKTFKGDIPTGDTPIPMSSSELMKRVDSVEKSIMDQLEMTPTSDATSSKFKHSTRPIVLFNEADPEIMYRAVKRYAQQFGNYLEFATLDEIRNLTAEERAQLLSLVGMSKLNIHRAALDPMRTKTILDYWLLNSTTHGRGVEPHDGVPDEKIRDEVYHIDPDLIGGSARGGGLNTVMLGDSGHGREGWYVYGRIPMDLSEQSLVDRMRSVKRLIGSPEYNFTDDEKKILFDCAISNGVVDKNGKLIIPIGEGIGDIHYVHNPYDLLRFTSGNSNPQVYRFLMDFSNRTGIKSLISKDVYWGSDDGIEPTYSSVIADIPNPMYIHKSLESGGMRPVDIASRNAVVDLILGAGDPSARFGKVDLLGFANKARQITPGMLSSIRETDPFYRLGYMETPSIIRNNSSYLQVLSKMFGEREPGSLFWASSYNPKTRMKPHLLFLDPQIKMFEKLWPTAKTNEYQLGKKYIADFYDIFGTDYGWNDPGVKHSKYLTAKDNLKARQKYQSLRYNDMTSDIFNFRRKVENDRMNVARGLLLGGAAAGVTGLGTYLYLDNKKSELAYEEMMKNQIHNMSNDDLTNEMNRQKEGILKFSLTDDPTNMTGYYQHKLDLLQNEFNSRLSNQ